MPVSITDFVIRSQKREFNISITGTVIVEKRGGGDYPGGPVVGVLFFHCKGLILGQGVKILPAVWCGQIHK